MSRQEQQLQGCHLANLGQQFPGTDLHDTCTELSLTDKIFNRHSDVPGNLPQKNGGDISSGMKWNRRASSIRVTILLVGAALSDLLKTQVV